MNFNHKESASTRAKVEAQVKTGEQFTTVDGTACINQIPLLLSIFSRGGE